MTVLDKELVSNLNTNNWSSEGSLLNTCELPNQQSHEVDGPCYVGSKSIYWASTFPRNNFMKWKERI